MDDFIDNCEKESGQDENKTPTVPDDNDSDYSDLSDADDYGSDASTIKCGPTPAAPPCKKKSLTKRKHKKKNKKKSKKRSKKKGKNEKEEDGDGTLITPNVESNATLPCQEQASFSSDGGSDLFRTPDFICGMVHDLDGDFLFLIKWTADGLEPTMDFVLAAFVNQLYPEIVVQFYDDLSHALMNGEWTVADYGNELYFFLNLGSSVVTYTIDDDEDWLSYFSDWCNFTNL